MNTQDNLKKLFKQYFKQEIIEINDSMFYYSLVPIIDLFKEKSSNILPDTNNLYHNLSLSIRSYIEQHASSFYCHPLLLDYLKNNNKLSSKEYLTIKLRKSDFSFNSNILDFIFLSKEWEHLSEKEQNHLKLFVQTSELQNKYSGIEDIDVSLINPTTRDLSIVFQNHYQLPIDKNDKKQIKESKYFFNLFTHYENEIKNHLVHVDSNEAKKQLDNMLSVITSGFLFSCYEFWFKDSSSHQMIIDFFNNLNIYNLDNYPKTQKILTYQIPTLCFTKLYEKQFIKVSVDDLSKLDWHTVDKSVKEFCMDYEYGHKYHTHLTYLSSYNLFETFSNEKKNLFEAFFLNCDDHFMVKSFKKFDTFYQADDIPTVFKVRQGDSDLQYIAPYLFNEKKIESLSYLISKKPALFKDIPIVSEDSVDYYEYSKLEQVYLNSTLLIEPKKNSIKI